VLLGVALSFPALAELLAGDSGSWPSRGVLGVVFKVDGHKGDLSSGLHGLVSSKQKPGSFDGELAVLLKPQLNVRLCRLRGQVVV
jgi:hypothetical protein